LALFQGNFQGFIPGKFSRGIPRTRQHGNFSRENCTSLNFSLENDQIQGKILVEPLFSVEFQGNCSNSNRFSRELNSLEIVFFQGLIQGNGPFSRESKS
jgi:hypothetical protein